METKTALLKYMKQLTEYDGKTTSDMQPWKNMTITANVDTWDLMMIIIWVTNTYSWSSKLEWVSWTHTIIIKSPRVTGGLIGFWSVAAAVSTTAAILPTLCNFPGKPLKLISSNHTWLTYGWGKNFVTHLGDLGSRSLICRSRTQFTLSPR